MNQTIHHSGIVDSVEDGCVHVRIVQTSACAACKVAGYCNAAESKEKIIDVYCDSYAKYKVGQPVGVYTTGGVEVKALLWAFGIPFILLLCVLFTTWSLTDDEGLSALCAILALVPYYFTIWLLRDKIREQLTFHIESEIN